MLITLILVKSCWLILEGLILLNLFVVFSCIAMKSLFPHDRSNILNKGDVNNKMFMMWLDNHAETLDIDGKIHEEH